MGRSGSAVIVVRNGGWGTADWVVAWSMDGTQSGAPAPSSGPGASGMTPSSASLPPGGWAGGTGGNAAASPSVPSLTPGSSGQPTNAPPAHSDPGGLPFGQDQGQVWYPSNTNASTPQTTPSLLQRPRTDPVEVGALLTAPLNATTGIIGPGAPLAVAVGANSGSATVVGVGAAPVPGSTALPGQPSPVMTAEGSGGEHAIAVGIVPAQRVCGRGGVASVRPARSSGRLNLSDAPPHLVLSSSSIAPPPVDTIREETMPSPRGADLIAEALPFVGDSLERSLDDFVRQLEQFDVDGLGADGPMPIIVATVAVLSAATSAIVLRDIVRRRSARQGGLRVVDPLGREFAWSFPELPRSWSEER